MPRLRRCLLTVTGLGTLSLLASACGGGGHRSAVSTTSSTGPSTTLAPSGGASTSTSAPGTTLPTTTGGSTTTTNSGSTTTTGPLGGVTTTTQAGQVTSSTTTAPPSSTSTRRTTTTSAKPTTTTTVASHTGGGPAPVVPGTYQERQSGSFTAAGKTTSYPPNGTLVVDPARADRSQVWHRYVKAGTSPSDTTVLFRANGPFLASTSMAGPSGQLTCTFNPPLPAPPYPTKVGQTFSGQASCGSFTVSVQGKVDGTKVVSVGGTQVPTFVVDSTITTKGQVTATGTQTDWYAPSLRLSVHEAVTEQGTYEAFPFKSQITSDLVSVRPS